MSTIVSAEIHASGAAELVTELLANQANRWCIDQRSHDVDVINKSAEVQSFVSILQVLQIHILQFGSGLLVQMSKYALLLLFDSFVSVRQEASDSETISLIRLEAGALIPQRIVQDILGLLGGLQRLKVLSDRLYTSVSLTASKIMSK